MSYMPIATKLIEAHWEYIENLLNAQGCPKDDINIARFHYKTAGYHFFKHALEEVAAGNIDAQRALLPKSQLALEPIAPDEYKGIYHEW